MNKAAMNFPTCLCVNIYFHFFRIMLRILRSKIGSYLQVERQTGDSVKCKMESRERGA